MLRSSAHRPQCHNRSASRFRLTPTTPPKMAFCRRMRSSLVTLRPSRERRVRTGTVECDRSEEVMQPLVFQVQKALTGLGQSLSLEDAREFIANNTEAGGAAGGPSPYPHAPLPAHANAPGARRSRSGQPAARPAATNGKWRASSHHATAKVTDRTGCRTDGLTLDDFEAVVRRMLFGDAHAISRAESGGVRACHCFTC